MAYENLHQRGERVIQLPKELLENCNGFSFDFGTYHLLPQSDKSNSSFCF